MKIALFTAHFPPQFTGGTEMVALAQARGLASRGHQVTVVSGTDVPHQGEDVLRETVEGVSVAFLPRKENEAADLALSWPRLLDLAMREAEGAEALVVHHQATLGSGLVRRLRSLGPVVLCLHDHHATCPRSFRRRPDGGTCPSRQEVRLEGHGACAECLAPVLGTGRTGQTTLALAARQRSFQAEVDAAARVIVPSRTHLVRLSEHLDFGPGQARILEPGLCIDLPLDRRTPKPWTGRGPLRILHPGRRGEEKGSLDLAHAVADLPPGRVQLVCIGDSEEGLDLAMARAAGATKMEWHGPYDAEDLARVASTCHLAALPSRLPESYSLCVDEALALGLPVWASGAEAARERYGALGLHAMPAADPCAWAEAFQDLVTDPALVRACMKDLPSTVPTARRSVETLERWIYDLARQHREHELSSPREHRRPA